MEVWNCSSPADSAEVDLITACNLTEDRGSVAGLRQLPRAVYTPACRVYDLVIETVLMRPTVTCCKTPSSSRDRSVEPRDRRETEVKREVGTYQGAETEAPRPRPRPSLWGPDGADGLAVSVRLRWQHAVDGLSAARQVTLGHAATHRTTPCHAAPRRVKPCHAMSSRVPPCHAAPRRVTPRHAVSRRVTPCPAASRCTTPCHAASRRVTPCHTMSRRVTPCPAASRSATPLLLISLEISDTLFLSAVFVVRVISSFQVAHHHPLSVLSFTLFFSETPVIQV